jgi:hypothetical protein
LTKSHSLEEAPAREEIPDKDIPDEDSKLDKATQKAKPFICPLRTSGE